jgi:hypothetical protein
MKMYDGSKIITGLIIGLGLFLSPIFYNLGTPAKPPVPELTAKAKDAQACVAPKAYMTAWHMQLLDQWRHEVVRDDNRYFNTNEEMKWDSFDYRLLDNWRRLVTTDNAIDKLSRMVTQSDVKDAGAPGKTYYKSLQLTCMDCHSNKTQFCDQCHNYMGVTPYCWDCHIAPKENQ